MHVDLLRLWIKKLRIKKLRIKKLRIESYESLHFIEQDRQWEAEVFEKNLKSLHFTKVRPNSSSNEVQDIQRWSLMKSKKFEWKPSSINHILALPLQHVGILLS